MPAATSSSGACSRLRAARWQRASWWPESATSSWETTDSAPKWSEMPRSHRTTRMSASSTTASGACTWPTTCSRNGTRWSSSTRYPAAATRARCMSSKPTMKLTINQVPAHPVWTVTAWIRPRCSPACGRWEAVRPTRSSSGARREASRKASASPNPSPRPSPGPRERSRRSWRRCRVRSLRQPLRQEC